MALAHIAWLQSQRNTEAVAAADCSMPVPATPRRPAVRANMNDKFVSLPTLTADLACLFQQEGSEHQVAGFQAAEENVRRYSAAAAVFVPDGKKKARSGREFVSDEVLCTWFPADGLRPVFDAAVTRAFVRTNACYYAHLSVFARVHTRKSVSCCSTPQAHVHVQCRGHTMHRPSIVRPNASGQSRVPYLFQLSIVTSLDSVAVLDNTERWHTLFVLVQEHECSLRGAHVVVGRDAAGACCLTTGGAPADGLGTEASRAVLQELLANHAADNHTAPVPVRCLSVADGNVASILHLMVFEVAATHSLGTI